MGSRLTPWRIALGSLAAATLTATALARAQTTTEVPPPAAVPAPAENSAPDVSPPDQAQPVPQAAPAPAGPVTPSLPEATPEAKSPPQAGRNSAAAKPPESAEAKKPPEPPKVVRSPVAILQALDKVTAETMRFAAPVGKMVRYKTLVFVVKACETRDLDAAEPKASAYVVVTSVPQSVTGGTAAPAKQVFKGWMFAQAPGVDALEHPIYDAWLIACSASIPAT
ncbi:MAG: DUF2155 domain-containing protein [Caulobacteraceae bacterium]